MKKIVNIPERHKGRGDLIERHHLEVLVRMSQRYLDVSFLKDNL